MDYIDTPREAGQRRYVVESDRGFQTYISGTYGSPSAAERRASYLRATIGNARVVTQVALPDASGALGWVEHA